MKAVKCLLFFLVSCLSLHCNQGNQTAFSPKLLPFFTENVQNPAIASTYKPIQGYEDIEQKLFYTIQFPIWDKGYLELRSEYIEDTIFEPHLYVRNEASKEKELYYITKDSIKGPFYHFWETKNYLTFFEKWENKASISPPAHLIFKRSPYKKFTQCASGLSLMQGKNTDVWVIRADYTKPLAKNENPDTCNRSTRYYLYNGDSIQVENLGGLNCVFDKEVFVTPYGNRVVIATRTKQEGGFATTYNFDYGKNLGKNFDAKITFAEESEAYFLLFWKNDLPYLFFNGKEFLLEKHKGVDFALSPNGMVLAQFFENPKAKIIFSTGDTVKIKGHLVEHFWDYSQQQFAWITLDDQLLSINWQDGTTEVIGKIHYKVVGGHLGTKRKIYSRDKQRFAMLLNVDKHELIIYKNLRNEYEKVEGFFNDLHYTQDDIFCYSENSITNKDTTTFSQTIHFSEIQKQFYFNHASGYGSHFFNSNLGFCLNQKGSLLWSDGYLSPNLIRMQMNTKDGYFYWLNQEGNKVYLNRRKIIPNK